MRRVAVRRLMVQEGEATRPTRFDYGTLCRDVVAQPPQGGYTFDQMVERRGLMGKLDQVAAEKRSELLLEETEHELLVRALKGYRWRVFSNAVIEMIEEIAAAPVVEVEVKKGGEGSEAPVVDG